MKMLALAGLALPFLLSAGCAQVSGAGPAVHALAAIHGSSTRPRAAVAVGRDGADPNSRCSNENPSIEYRDCVNASTRDPNAKVRLG
jgi:hypothetical protein